MPEQLTPMALSPANTAKLLTNAGGKQVSVETIEADIANGAPTNPDDTLNLVHYAAWLVKELAKRGHRSS